VSCGINFLYRGVICTLLSFLSAWFESVQSTLIAWAHRVNSVACLLSYVMSEHLIVNGTRASVLTLQVLPDAVSIISHVIFTHHVRHLLDESIYTTVSTALNDVFGFYHYAFDFMLAFLDLFTHYAVGETDEERLHLSQRLSIRIWKEYNQGRDEDNMQFGPENLRIIVTNGVRPQVVFRALMVLQNDQTIGGLLSGDEHDTYDQAMESLRMKLQQWGEVKVMWPLDLD